MAEVLPDLIKDSGLEVDDGTISIRRSFVVRDISASGDADPSVLWQAFTASGIPPKNSPHPVVTICRAKRFSVVGMSNNMAAVVVTYIYEGRDQNGAEGWVVQFDSNVRSETTDVERDEITPLNVFWSGAKDKDGALKPQIAPVQVYKPAKRLVFKRRWQGGQQVLGIQTLSYPTYPETLQDRFLGKVNLSAFRGGIPHTWLCSGIDAITTDYGRSYEITANFDYRQETWDIWAIYRMASGGYPPNAKRVPEDGYKRFTKLYYEADFSEFLNLPIT